MVQNVYGQLIGLPVAGWTARRPPPRTPMVGRFCRIVPVEGAHADALFDAYGKAADARDWTYLPLDPARDRDDYRSWIATMAANPDVLLHAIIVGERPVGVAAFMRIDCVHGTIEVGSINYAPALQRTAAATEAMILMMRRVFDQLGYRRYEWKCDALNARSRAAAQRLGFCYEGTFRRAMVTKGRNRDTAWFSIIDSDWPAIRAAQDAWLAPGNFDNDGRQKQRLGDVIGRARMAD